MFILEALGVTNKVGYPRAYDHVIQDLATKQQTGDKTWVATIVNTDHSSGTGIHYNYCRYGLDENSVPRALFLEPYRNRKLSAHMVKALKAEIPEARTRHYGTGVQKARDNYSCGYITTYWAAVGYDGNTDICDPSTPPKGWEDVVLRLMDASDMLADDNRVRASDIGLKPMFAQALGTGVFQASEFISQIDNFIEEYADTREVNTTHHKSHCTSSSMMMCLRCPEPCWWE